MIHFLPESPAEALETATPAPYAEAVARLASIRQALACVEEIAGQVPSQRDSEARLAVMFPATGPIARACFESRSSRIAAAAAAGLEVIATKQAEGRTANPAAIARLAAELHEGLDDLDMLFSL